LGYIKAMQVVQYT